MTKEFEDRGNTYCNLVCRHSCFSFYDIFNLCFLRIGQLCLIAVLKRRPMKITACGSMVHTVSPLDTGSRW